MKVIVHSPGTSGSALSVVAVSIFFTQELFLSDTTRVGRCLMGPYFLLFTAWHTFT